MLTQKELKERIEYNPETGKFVVIKDTKTGKRREGLLAGWTNMRGYREIKIQGKCYIASRLAFLYMTGEFPKFEVDHINRIRSDDRWCNLRDASKELQMLNRGEHKRSQKLPKNIHFYRKYFIVSATRNGKRHYLGAYFTLDEAIKNKKLLLTPLDQTII